MRAFGVQRWRQAALCWLHRQVSAQHRTIRQAQVFCLTLLHIYTVQKGSHRHTVKLGYQQKAVIAWIVGESQGSAGTELGLYRQTPGGAVGSRQKAATPGFVFFFLFPFHFIFVSYSLSAVGVDDPLLLRGHLISPEGGVL